jgi:excisionase family DNA binding protein
VSDLPPTTPPPAETADDPTHLAATQSGKSGRRGQTPPRVFLPGEELVSDIELVRLLGRGGMGDVYLARGRRSGQLFAVKRPTADSAEARESFLEELQSWLDLPPHPHVVAARFVRSLGSELAVFSEYVDGGSLEEWISQGRVDSLARALDLAIQFAWGLDAAHTAGLVHQDVKPANALVTLDGTLKVADFGLARLRLAHDAVFAGYTPRFCSPEQQRFERVTVGTDVWSLGVSMLQLFAGGCFWTEGPRAGEALEQLVSGRVVGRIELPAPVVAVLRRCLAPAAEDRWPSARAVADALVAAHAALLGPYARPAPGASARPQTSGAFRRLSTGARWRPGRDWLAMALTAAGRDPLEVPGAAEPERAARHARALGEAQRMRQAEALLEAAVDQGHAECAWLLAALRGDLATVSQALEDVPGALQLLDLALVDLQRGVDPGGPASAWLRAGLEDALSVLELKRGQAALALEASERAVRARSALVDQPDQDPAAIAFEQAVSRVNRGTALATLGRLGEAVAALVEATSAIEALRLGEADEGGRLQALAQACLPLSAALRASGQHQAALEAAQRGLALFDRGEVDAVREGCLELLGLLHRNLAINAASLGRRDQAVASLSTSVEVLAEVVASGREDVAAELALAQGSLAFQSGRLGPAPEVQARSHALFAQARASLQGLVAQKGRQDLETELARVCINEAVVRLEAGDGERPLALVQEAVRLREGVVARQPDLRAQEELALALRHLAMVLTARGEAEPALEAGERAVAALAHVEAEPGPTEARSTLAFALEDLAQAAGQLGRVDLGLGYAQRAVRQFSVLVAGGRTADLGHNLALARLTRARLRAAAGERAAAYAELDQALSALDAIVPSPRTRDLVALELLEVQRALWLQDGARGGAGLPGRDHRRAGPAVRRRARARARAEAGAGVHAGRDGGRPGPGRPGRAGLLRARGGRALAPGPRGRRRPGLCAAAAGGVSPQLGRPPRRPRGPGRGHSGARARGPAAPRAHRLRPAFGLGSPVLRPVGPRVSAARGQRNLRRSWGGGDESCGSRTRGPRLKSHDQERGQTLADFGKPAQFQGNQPAHIVRPSQGLAALGSNFGPPVVQANLDQEKPRAAGRPLSPVRVVVPLLTVAEVAVQLQVSREHVYRLVKWGQLAAVRVGAAIRVKPEAVEAFLAKGG